MANWQRKVKLNPEWGRAKDGEVTINELAGVIAARLKALVPFGDDDLDNERDEIVEELESLAADQSAAISDIDDIMDRLFDWGDSSLDDNWNGKKACWIDTISA